MRECAAVLNAAAHRANSNNSTAILFSFISLTDVISALEEVSIDVAQFESMPANHRTNFSSAHARLSNSLLTSMSKVSRHPSTSCQARCYPIPPLLRNSTSRPKGGSDAGLMAEEGAACAGVTRIMRTVKGKKATKDIRISIYLTSNKETETIATNPRTRKQRRRDFFNKGFHRADARRESHTR